MYKAVYALIEDDKVLIQIFLFDEENNMLNANQLYLFNIFLQNPKIVNISNLGYIPEFNTPYINETFISTDKNKATPLPDYLDVETQNWFSLILEDTHRAVYRISNKSEDGLLVAAILSSNPTIKIETIEE